MTTITFARFQDFVQHGDFTTNDRDRQFLGALGFAGEVGEVLELHVRAVQIPNPIPINRADLVKEMGDVLWYFAFMCNYYSITENDFPTNGVSNIYYDTSREGLLELASNLAVEAAKVLEIHKKHMIHGKPLDRGALMRQIGAAMAYYVALEVAHGLNTEDTMMGNVEKLCARWPDRYGPSSNWFLE